MFEYHIAFSFTPYIFFCEIFICFHLIQSVYERTHHRIIRDSYTARPDATKLSRRIVRCELAISIKLSAHQNENSANLPVAELACRRGVQWKWTYLLTEIWSAYN